MVLLQGWEEMQIMGPKGEVISFILRSILLVCAVISLWEAYNESVQINRIEDYVYTILMISIYKVLKQCDE